MSNGVNFNYSQICQSLLKDLPERQREILWRRFGLDGRERETLQSIGESYNITRERVRQIEEDGILKIKSGLKEYQKILQYFRDHLKTTGELRKEDVLLSQLGGEKYQAPVFFLLTLGDNFQRFSETRDLHSLWTIDPNSLKEAQKIIDSFYQTLLKLNRPLTLEEFNPVDQEKKWLPFYLEISKKIQPSKEEGFFGLKDWPEINPRGVKDKAYLIFKKEKRFLHFNEVANLIEGRALPQTVHNELIKDPRFVLVGRGLYALREWGYEPGVVKDVIFRILEEAKKPLAREEILERVLKQRLVKENTVFLNLNDKKYFQRDSRGRYFLIR